MKIPKGKSREAAPEGTHNAVAVQVIDMGTQVSNDPKFQDTRRVQIAFELVDEQTEDGQPFVAYADYNFTSSSGGNLAKMLKAWLNVKDFDEFDMSTILAKPALINIEHKDTKSGGTWAKVVSVTGLPKGVKVKKHSEELKALFLDETFDQEIFDSLPEFLQKKISDSDEYAEIMEPRLNKSNKNKIEKKPAKRSQQVVEDDDEDEKPKRKERVTGATKPATTTNRARR